MLHVARHCESRNACILCRFRISARFSDSRDAELIRSAQHRTARSCYPGSCDRKCRRIQESARNPTENPDLTHSDDMRATKRYTHVAIRGLAHVDAPHVVTSADLEERLAEAFGHLKISNGLLEKSPASTSAASGTRGRGPDVATLAGEKALARAASPATTSACWSTPRSAATTSSRPPQSSCPATSACRRELPELRRRQRLPRVPQRHGHRQPHDRARRDRLRAGRRRRDRRTWSTRTP